MWDRLVMFEALITGFEVDFFCMLIAEIHERAFRTTTTLSFPCLIFLLCRDVGLTIRHYEKIVMEI